MYSPKDSYPVKLVRSFTFMKNFASIVSLIFLPKLHFEIKLRFGYEIH